MKQTSVEWLANRIIDLEERLRLKEINLNDFIEEKDLLVEQAKAMEKEQIREAYISGADHVMDVQYNPTSYFNDEQYYNETFKSE
jgi:hypothetical protein